MAARDAFLRRWLDATARYAIIGTNADGLITVAFNGGPARVLGCTQASDVISRDHSPMYLFHDPEEAQAPRP